MKFVFIIVAVLGLFFSAQAQNANRSGAFIEFSGGYVVGDLPVSDIQHSSSIIGDKYVKTETFVYMYDFTLQLSGGYRWAFARHWALEGKVGFLYPIRYTECYMMKIGPALRYTSNEFGNSNSSIYVALNPNAIYQFKVSNFNFGYEIQAGVNLSPKFSIGVIWNANFWNADNYQKYAISKTIPNITHTGSLGVNFGYRF